MTTSPVTSAAGRSCLLVIGMHRSGTSALTRVLSLLGAALPRQILGADRDNAAGHWEPERLIPAHDALLAEAASSWQDWRPFPKAALAPQRLAHHRAEIRRLIGEEFGDAPLFVLKDPRVCRLVPLYVDVLTELGVAVRPVIVFRNPLEVAASLAARNGMGKAHAALLWLRSVLDAERDSRGLPRVIVGYDRLLEEGAAAVADWDHRLGITWPAPMEAVAPLIEVVLRRDLRHHAIAADHLAIDAVTAGWVADAFAALTALARDEADAAAPATLDRVAAEFARLTPILMALETDARSESDALRDEVARRRAAAAAEITALEAENAAREVALTARITALETGAAAQRAELTERIEQAEAAACAREAELTARMERTRAEGVAREAELSNQLGAMRIEVAAREAAALAHVADLETEFATREATLATRAARAEAKLLAREEAAAAAAAAFEDVIAGERTRVEHLRMQYDVLTNSRRYRAASTLASLYHRLPRPIRRSVEWALRKRLRLRLKRQQRIIERSGRFDARYYLHTNPDVSQMEMDPIRHYLLYGAREGRNPSAEFDTRTYLALHPDAGRSGENPLVHALRAGTFWTSGQAQPEVRVDWRPLRSAQLRDVSVIIPVYNGRAHLERLLPALVRNTPRDVEVIFLDDASPDAGVTELIESALGELPRSRLIRSPANRGFVRTVNAAAELARRHFVLLNTDTDVPPGWVERLMAPIFADPGIASATPFSNAATIFSFPQPNVDNRLAGGLSVERIDEAFRSLPKQHWPPAGDLEVPTGVGFCMGINGDVWRELGGFDAEAFGRGYGEENDWCQRSVARGYRHVLVPNLFVHHDHGGSFSAAEKRKLIEDHMAVLTQRWPDYVPAVHAHIARDPWRDVRTRALERLCLANRPLLIFDHALGGGANAYRQQLVRRADAAGQPAVVVTYRSGPEALGAEFHFSGAEATRTAPQLEQLVDPVLLGSGAELVYNDLVGWPQPLATVALLRSLAERADVHTRVLLHDFYPLCPSYTLLDDSTRFCGVPADMAECRRCLAGNPHAHLAADPGQWRAVWGSFLEAADEIVCFSPSSRAILSRAYPALGERVLVRPHDPVTTITRAARVVAGRPLTVGVIGGINVAKGARVVMGLCEHLLTVDREARVVVIGEVDPAERKALSNLTIHGRYASSDLLALVEHHGVNACLMPSIWPETFSYVTQEIMAMELPLVCFDLGAPAERVRDYRYGAVIEPGPAAAVCDALERVRQRREVCEKGGQGPEITTSGRRK